jgi:regulator of protease activity HflC (stomatin/prohibitin superfamily)
MFLTFAILLLTSVLLAFYLFSCFTRVNEGSAKIVVRFGAYRKTLLQKQGHTTDDSGNVVLGENPNFHIGGLYWVSWLKPFGIDKVYTTTMKFVKALSDGSFERRSDENTDFILCMDYQYGLEFNSAEDGDGLPLNGKMTMTARIINPHAAMFLVKDWYDALVGRVLPRVREYISEHRYEDIIKDKGTQLDADVFKTLNEKDKENDGPSIVSILKDQYGIMLVALETVNIDPPPEYRETTLKEYIAKQRVKVAAQDKVVEAEETGGALQLMVDRQIASMKAHYPNLEKSDIMRIRQECLNILVRDRALKAGALREIRLGNADGTSFGSGSISEIVGSIVVATLAANTGKSQKQNNPSKKGGAGATNLSSDNPTDAAERYFKRHGKYPDWDPLKRTPK